MGQGSEGWLESSWGADAATARSHPQRAHHRQGTDKSAPSHLPPLRVHLPPPPRSLLLCACCCRRAVTPGRYFCALTAAVAPLHLVLLRRCIRSSCVAVSLTPSAHSPSPMQHHTQHRRIAVFVAAALVATAALVAVANSPEK